MRSKTSYRSPLDPINRTWLNLGNLGCAGPGAWAYNYPPFDFNDPSVPSDKINARADEDAFVMRSQCRFQLINSFD